MSASPSAPARPLLVFPCNGNGVEALDCLGEHYSMAGFIDDSPDKRDTSVHGFAVLGRAALQAWPDAHVLAVPGSPTSFRQRRTAIESLGLERERLACVVHPSARVSPRATIGRNVLLMAGVVVTGGAVIADHVCVLPNTVIHHDTVIGAWTLIGSNVTIAGGVTVEENCYIGSGTSVMNGLRIGSGALIGLASNVIRNVEPGSVSAGNPARRLR